MHTTRALALLTVAVTTGCSSTPGPRQSDIIPVVAGPASPAVSAPTGLIAFAGRWSQHAGQMTVAPDGTIQLTYQAYDSGLTAQFPDLTLKVTAQNDQTATATVRKSDYPPVRVGATFTLRLGSPGVLELTFPDRRSSKWCDRQRFAEGICGA